LISLMAGKVWKTSPIEDILMSNMRMGEFFS
jgi:hypothetical protein